ncbi:MAG: Uma2 family endonuclease [Ruminiclostridium sp.]|nr:Uma2 family endonuclease [Ruminiclostridium sp.]
MLSEKKERRYTSDEFLAMTELDGQYELIDGYIYDMAPAPSPLHQDIAGYFYRTVWDYIERNNGKCHAYMGPLDVKLDDENTVEPDVLVVCDPDKIDKKRCIGAPDWVIEIVSPSDTQRDTVDKLGLYSKAGVREYWIVFPEERQMLVYLFEAPNTTGIFTFDDEIPVSIYKDAPEPLKIRISDFLPKNR